jgi:hypothetical protein
MRQSIGAIAKSTIADITIEGSHPGQREDQIPV